MAELPLFLRIILIPFSLLYGLMLEIRNYFYDRGFFRVHRFDVPVISIGNLTLGGTGKTPFTIFLAGLLNKDFKKIAVISRGYGRRSKGLQVVSDGKRILLNSEQGGDEPVLIATRLPKAVVIVSENRAAGIEYAIRHFAPELIILDDAYQHRKVFRDVNILLVNAKEKFFNNFPPPAGSLREFRHNYNRADLVILTNTHQEMKSLDFSPIPVFKSIVLAKELIDFNFEPAGKLTELPAKDVVAFAGIAHPKNFLNTLKSAGVSVRNFKRFSDHQKYAKKDLVDLVGISRRSSSLCILCTEKDLVKIREIQKADQILSDAGIKLLAVRLKMDVEKSPELHKFIFAHLDINK